MTQVPQKLYQSLGYPNARAYKAHMRKELADIARRLDRLAQGSAVTPFYGNLKRTRDDLAATRHNASEKVWGR